MKISTLVYLLAFILLDAYLLLNDAANRTLIIVNLAMVYGYVVGQICATISLLKKE